MLPIYFRVIKSQYFQKSAYLIVNIKILQEPPKKKKRATKEKKTSEKKEPAKKTETKKKSTATKKKGISVQSLIRRPMDVFVVFLCQFTKICSLF